MKREFKVGDRVSVEKYSGASWRSTLNKLESCTTYILRGTIVDAKDGGYLVRLDAADPRWPLCTHEIATPRMMKRLVKKKRREFWIKPSRITDNSLCVPVILEFKPPNEHDYIHVREVKSK
jgi:hypothetical protein